MNSRVVLKPPRLPTACLYLQSYDKPPVGYFSGANVGARLLFIWALIGQRSIAVERQESVVEGVWRQRASESSNCMSCSPGSLSNALSLRLALNLILRPGDGADRRGEYDGGRARANMAQDPALCCCVASTRRFINSNDVCRNATPTRPSSARSQDTTDAARSANSSIRLVRHRTGHSLVAGSLCFSPVIPALGALVQWSAEAW